MDHNIFSSGASKLFLFPKKIENLKNNKAIIPTTLEIQPSERCNHFCPNCQSKIEFSKEVANEKKLNGVFLDFSILASIWEYPPDGIIISGNTGDPLLHPQITDLLQTIKNNNIPMVLITNGQNLNFKISKIILKCCTGIRISIDSYNSVSFSNTHGGSYSQWNKLLSNLKLLIKLKNELNSKCLIGYGYLTNKNTKEGMLNATKLAKKLNFDYIHFRPYHFDETSINKELKNCSYEETKDFKVYSSDQKYKLLNNPKRNYKKCLGAWFYTVIDPNGELYICCHHIGNQKAYLGSLLKNNWHDIIYSNSREKTINEFNTTNCLPNCRLHTQNELLNNLLLDKNSNYKKIENKLIISHGSFL